MIAVTDWPADLSKSNLQLNCFVSFKIVFKFVVFNHNDICRKFQLCRPTVRCHPSWRGFCSDQSKQHVGQRLHEKHPDKVLRYIVNPDFYHTSSVISEQSGIHGITRKFFAFFTEVIVNFATCSISHHYFCDVFNFVFLLFLIN